MTRVILRIRGGLQLGRLSVVKYPTAEAGGLQLGASCYKRPIDRCPRDIESGIVVSVPTVAAGLTDKGGLTLAVLFCAVSTHMARSGRVAWVDRVQWYTEKRGLVGKELTELSKGPGGMARTLRVSNRAIRAFADVP